MDLQQRWHTLQQCVTGLQTKQETSLFDDIEEMYAPNATRQYHTLTHIQDCLRNLDWVWSLTPNAYVIEFALWLHDIGYDSHRPNNEEYSAYVANHMMQLLGVSREFSHHVHTLILVTKHDREPDTRDEQIMVDVDLASLGYPPEAYDRKVDRIYREFSWVPRRVFRTHRAALLRKFLAGYPTYHTPELEDLYGDQARENLRRELTYLTGEVHHAP